MSIGIDTELLIEVGGVKCFCIFIFPWPSPWADVLQDTEFETLSTSVIKAPLHILRNGPSHRLLLFAIN
jgi:hypothetical protein